MKKSIDEVVLSVVIPCYNEKNSIEEIAKKVRSFFRLFFDFKTPEILTALF